MALYKLCSTSEEHKKLQQNYTDLTTDGEKIQQQMPMTPEQAKAYLNKLDNELWPKTI